MLNRVIVLIAGVVIAYSTAYFGDWLYISIATKITSQGITDGSDWLLFGVMLVVLGTIFGLSSWREAMSSIDRESRSINMALDAMKALVCLSCLFGIIAGPFANYGPYPFNWASRWIWILLLALVPSLLIGADLISEAISKIKNKDGVSDKDSGLNFMRKVA